MSDEYKNAWYAICNELRNIDPRWGTYGTTGIDSARNFIRDLAIRAKGNEEKVRLGYSESVRREFLKRFEELATNPPLMGVYSVNDTLKMTKSRVPDVASIELVEELLRETLVISKEMSKLNTDSMKSLINIQNRLVHLLIELKSD